MVLCQKGMEGYGVKHNLSYQQFADIIKIKSFHNLNFDKKIVKYISCEISFFSVTVIQKKYLLNDWKMYHLSPLSEPKQKVKFKTQ